MNKEQSEAQAKFLEADKKRKAELAAQAGQKVAAKRPWEEKDPAVSGAAESADLYAGVNHASPAETKKDRPERLKALRKAYKKYNAIDADLLLDLLDELCGCVEDKPDGTE